MLGFKSLVALIAVVSLAIGGLVAYMDDRGDDGNVVGASGPGQAGDAADFLIPDEIRQQLPEGFQIPPEVEQALRQRLEQGLIPPEVQQAFLNGEFDFSAAPEGFGGGRFQQFAPGGDGN